MRVIELAMRYQSAVVAVEVGDVAVEVVVTPALPVPDPFGDNAAGSVASDCRVVVGPDYSKAEQHTGSGQSRPLRRADKLPSWDRRTRHTFG